MVFLMKPTGRWRGIQLTILTLALGAALALPRASWADSTDLRIRGQVMDPSGAPVPGAKVRIINEASNLTTTVLATHEGKFAVCCLPPGAYAVEITSPGFKKWVRKKLNISESDVMTLEPTLDVGVSGPVAVVYGCSDCLPFEPCGPCSASSPAPLTGLMKGMVTDWMGNHLAFAEVRAIAKEFGKIIAAAQTNTDGQFAIDEVPAGPYRVEVSSPRFGGWVLKEFNVVPNSSNDFRVVLGGGAPNGSGVRSVPIVRYGVHARIKGEVHDGQGVAVPVANIRIIDRGGNTVFATIPTVAGKFYVFELSPGTYTVEVSSPDFVNWVQRNTLVTEQLVSNIEVSLASKRGTQTAVRTPQQLLTGSVTDEAGNQIVGALVRVTNEKSKATTVEQVNTDGRFAFSDLAPGPYTMEVSFPAFETWTQKHVEATGPRASGLKVVMALAGVGHK
jgi:hypothetical protein